MTLKRSRMMTLACLVFSLFTAACASAPKARSTVDSSSTPLFPISKSDFYYCEVDSELHRKMYPAIRLRASRMPDYFEFILPTGGSVPGKCYILALPGY